MKFALQFNYAASDPLLWSQNALDSFMLLLDYICAWGDKKNSPLYLYETHGMGNPLCRYFQCLQYRPAS